MVRVRRVCGREAVSHFIPYQASKASKQCGDPSFPQFDPSSEKEKDMHDSRTSRYLSVRAETEMSKMVD